MPQLEFTAGAQHLLMPLFSITIVFNNMSAAAIFLPQVVVLRYKENPNKFTNCFWILDYVHLWSKKRRVCPTFKCISSVFSVYKNVSFWNKFCTQQLIQYILKVVTSEKIGGSRVISTLSTWYGGVVMGVLLHFNEAAILYRHFNCAPLQKQKIIVFAANNSRCCKCHVAPTIIL